MSPRTVQQNELIREQRRVQIMEAAFRVFGQFGYVASSMAQIAKVANVSKGLLYNYFDSKEALLQSMFEFFMQNADSFWQKDESISAKENLLSLLEASFKLIDQHREMSRLVSQIAMQKDVMQGLEGHIQEMLLEKVQLLELVLKEMGIEDYKGEAMYLGALLDGVGFGVLVLDDQYPLEMMKEKIYKRYDLL